MNGRGGSERNGFDFFGLKNTYYVINKDDVDTLSLGKPCSLSRLRESPRVKSRLSTLTGRPVTHW